MLGVGHNAGAGVDVDTIETALPVKFGDQAAGEPLAVGRNQVGGARREFLHGGQSTQQVIEGLKLLIQP